MTRRLVAALALALGLVVAGVAVGVAGYDDAPRAAPAPAPSTVSSRAVPVAAVEPVEPVEPVDLTGAVPWEDRTDARPWSPPGEGPWVAEPPSRFPTLTLRLRLPSAVSPGLPFDYVVEICNAGRRTVDLRPCPAYAQQLTDTDADHGPRWLRGGRSVLRLACDAAPLLDPGGRHRFAMRTTVPEQAAGGAVLLRWGFVDDLAEGPVQESVDLTPAP